MKFNPISREVFTDQGEFLKKLDCPFKMDWEAMAISGEAHRKCPVCNHLVVDTEKFNDTELLAFVKEDPKACLKINLNQHNVILITDGLISSK
jgi:hypothetical protein